MKLYKKKGKSYLIYITHLFKLFLWLVETRNENLYNLLIFCCFQDLFNIAHSILVQLLPSFLIYVHVMHPYIRMDMTAA